MAWWVVWFGLVKCGMVGRVGGGCGVQCDAACCAAI